MEHDGKCEQSRILEEVRVRLNATLPELRVVRDKEICFCYERHMWEFKDEYVGSRLADRIATGVALVMESRMSSLMALRVGDQDLREEVREVGYVSDFSPENVIRIDFQERRRIVD